MRSAFGISLRCVVTAFAVVQWVYAEHLISIGARMQVLDGWIAYPADISDLSVLTNNAEIKIYRELGATCFKVVAKHICLDQTVPVIAVSEVGAKELLGQVGKIMQYGPRDYFLTVDTPPVKWKRFRSIDRHQDWNVNSLSDRSYDHFVEYMVRLIECIVRNGFPPPSAICPQCDADLIAGRPAGCYYTPHQWNALVVKLRRALDANGYVGIRIVGPDMMSHKATLDVLRTAERPFAFSVLAIKDFPGSRREAGVARDVVSDWRGNGGGAIWCYGWSPCTARNEWEQCTQIVDRLATDMTEMGVSAWGLRTTYRFEPRSDALVFEEGQTATAFAVLSGLWSEVRPGATIYRLEHRNCSDNESECRANGVAFKSNDGRWCIVMYNGSNRECEMRLPTSQATLVRCWNEAFTKSISYEEGVQSNVKVPSQSIALVIQRKIFR